MFWHNMLKIIGNSLYFPRHDAGWQHGQRVNRTMRFLPCGTPGRPWVMHEDGLRQLDWLGWSSFRLQRLPDPGGIGPERQAVRGRMRL